MQRSTVRALALAVLGALALAGPLHAQAGSIEGRVQERGGEPVAGVTVHVLGTSLIDDSDERGRFMLTGLRPGSYRLRLERLGYESRTVAVTVPAGRPKVVVLEPRPVEVAGVTAIGSPEELAEVRERLRRIPGAVDLVEREDIERTRAANLHDVLRYVPGVWVQPRVGAADESQLSIRGSGLRNNFHLRGVNVLVNGMPYRNADGFTDFESLELLSTTNIQVYKGANAFRFGGSTLGGAINLETRTGYTAEPFSAFAQSGSFGFLKAQASSGGVLGAANYYLSYAHTTLDGYREFSAQRRDRINAHLGGILTSTTELRGFYFFAHVEEELPGSLTRAEMEADPTAASPINVAGRWGRDYDLHHLGVQLRTQLGSDHRIEIAPYLQVRDIVHPIFRVLDQTSTDVGAELRYENTAELGGRGSRLTLGVQPTWGRIDNRHFENVDGRPGALAKDQEEQAGGVAVYVEEGLDLTSRLTAILGLRYDHSRRELDDRFLADGDQTDTRSYETLSPRVGLLVDLPAVDGQLFGNASRTVEPPLLLELNSFTVPGFVDLDAQDAWQFEVGARGRTPTWSWQVAAYDIELEDEIVNANLPPFPDAPFTVPTYRNVPAARHYGLEVGVDWSPDVPLLTGADGGDRITARLAWTWARYEYVEDPTYAGNEIPGAPEHAIQAELEYAHPAGLTIRPNVEWVPDEYFVDSANTVTNDGWATVGLRAEWSLPSLGALAFVEARNLTDARYAPAVTVDDAAERYFQPADGRSVYAGLRWELSR